MNLPPNMPAVAAPIIPTPRPAPELFGRDELLKTLVALTRARTPLAIYGLPGAGKTALALALANDFLVAADFPAGRAWIEAGPDADGSRLGEANVRKAQGDVLQFQKQMDEALARYDDALALFRAVGDRLGEANVHANEPLWHKRFWDRIVRGPDELQRIRDYIHANPARWSADQLHPDAPPNRWNQWHLP